MSKCTLPNEYVEPYIGEPLQWMTSFIAIRARQVYQELKAIDVNEATGPDLISARILKTLASQLAVPLAILCRRLLYEGVWPECWKIHHLVPIFK